MSFQDFWTLYPKKVAKRNAEKAWGRLTMFDQQTALDVLNTHIASWADRPIDRIPHAATWIRGERFNDDLSHVTRATNRKFFQTHGWYPRAEDA